MMIRTGTGGMDLIREAFERSYGYERVYNNGKLMRIVKSRNKEIRRDPKGRFYILVKL